VSDSPRRPRQRLRGLLRKLLRYSDDRAEPPKGAVERSAIAGQGAAKEQREYPFWHLWR
jgi:hypothetical protein